MPAKKAAFPFEESLAKLESLVEKMEAGELSLEESLVTFEEGVKLTRECQQALAQAEQKVKILIESQEGVSEALFNSERDMDE